ncbi:unnamed protein product [Symbiodinium natans]|uniref:Uncharacterized protein n=1 Tax=Symbiodinium natans TaxID=878477 RepID=A0A812TV87_9DINO|nr:unnamed protein product [Symbiodinium natans]
MPPQSRKETGSKGQPKGAGKTKAAAPLLSAVRFVPPASVVSALQARAGRAQNAVLAAEEQHAGKRTLAQEANWLATQVAKTTKRLEADLRAKQDLGEAALQWHSQLAEHLSTNYAEVERLAGQLDADVKEALKILTPLVSTTTSDATQVLLHKGAQNAGPIWPPQVTGLLEMAANALRAVAALDPLGHNRAPAVGGGVPSVPTQTQGIGGHHARRQPPGLDGGIFPGAMLTSGSPTMVTESHRAQPPPVSGNRFKHARSRATGWNAGGCAMAAGKHRQNPHPSLTPNLVLDGTCPFCTGGAGWIRWFQRANEDWQQWQLSWITAWNTSVGQLMDMCGAAATAAQSNPVLQEVLPEPPHMDTEEVRNQCQSTLRSLQQHPWACGPEIATVVEDLMRCYSCLKSCPAAVPDCPQAVLLLGHILHAAVQDVMSYTPQCTEEWLFPQLVLGKHPDLAARLGASTPALPHHALLQTCACCIAVQGTEFLLAALSAGVLLGCVWTTLADPPHFKPLGQMAYDLPSEHQVLGLLLAAMGCGLALAPCLLMVVVAWLPIGVFLLGLLSPALPPQHTRREPWCKNKRTRETAVKQMKGCFFLCLLFSPVGASGLPKIHNPEHVRQEEGVVSMPDNNEADDSFMMQVAGQAHFNRIPAWSLSRVPRIRIRRELHPLEEVGARPLAMQELCTATYTRKLAVFHGGVVEGPEPILFRVDSRLFRPALDEAIVQALGISADAVDVLMLASPFDSVTREQYVLRPRAFPWYAQAVPVLVRGELDSFHVLQAARDEQCHDLVAAAALLTQMQSIPEAEQCQCVEGTFVADSQPLLQPRCDAIVWTPIALKQRLSEASAHSPYADMHSNQGPPSQTLLSCVIITANGIIHALTPAFAPDSETFRFLRGEFPELASLTMRRMRYALTDLPPTQFLAFRREELGRHSLVVDLRALDLGLLTLTVPRYISCSQILDVTARDHARILDTAAMHEHVMSGDYICLLHDQAVGPDVMLDVAGFDLLRAYRHTLVEVPIGSDSENAASRGASLAKALLIAAAPLRGPVGSMCLLLVVGASQALAGRAASAPPHRSGRLQRVPAPPCNLPNKASQATHAAIQRELLASGKLLTPVISPSPLGNDDPREVTFKLWHPGRVLTRCYPAQWPWFDVHADLLETVSALGRYVVLPAAATPDHRAVHMVAISSADTHSTILVARAGSWKCLDVDWRNPAADIHAWVESLDGTHSYRIDCAHRGRMRHGDVCVVVDTFQSASPTLLDISTLSLTMPVGCSWTRTIGRQVFPLLQAGQPHLWLPRVQGVTARDTAMDMLHTLRSPNPETTHLLDVPPYLLGLPGPILLAAPRGGMCTLVWLHDCHECVPHGVAFAVEGVFPSRADLLYALRELPGAAAAIWLRATEMFLLWGPSESLHSADNEAVVAEIVTASVDMRLLLSHSRTDSLSSAPHMGAQGMASMPGPQEARSSQISSLDSSLADPCIPTLGIPDEGTLHVVYCGAIQTSCVVPCPSRRMPWALIIGDEIRTACTDQTSWAEVATVADLSVLDLQGVAVVLDGFRWMWPEPITHLGHACGTLLRRTPNKDSRCYVESEHTLPPSPLQARSSCGGMRLAKWAQLVAWTASAPCTGRWLPIALLVNAAMAMVVPVDPTAARPPLMCVPPPGFLLFVDVLNCFLQHPPVEGTLLRIWRPCRGPAVYQFRQQVDLDNLSTWLREQGCRPTRDVVHLAHDSGPDAIDLLCTPPASGAWWILRDGSHRELLRPVCQLPDISEQLVTIDEGGQAHRLICGGQADLRPELLPGKRAAIGRSVPNWYGALAGTGLMMFSTSACWRLAPVMLATIIVVQPVGGQTIPASHPRRVWTFGLPEPVDLPTTARTVTDARLVLVRAHLPRQLDNDGKLLEVSPPLIQGVQHWLYVPRTRVGTYTYLLMQWHRQAAVFESRSNPLDWDALFQWATSVFTLEQPLAQKFVLVLDRQIFRFGTIVSGLRHGQLLAIGEHTPSRSPMRYLNPWGEEEELPEIVRSDWGDTLLTGPGGQISLRPEGPAFLTATAGRSEATSPAARSPCQTGLNMEAALGRNLRPLQGIVPRYFSLVHRRGLWVMLLLGNLLICGVEAPPAPVGVEQALVSATGASIPGGGHTEHAHCNVTLPLNGNTLSWSVRDASPEQHGALQAQLSTVWQARAGGRRVEESPSWPRTAGKFLIHSPAVPRQPLTGRFLLTEDCLNELYDISEIWRRQAQVDAVIPLSPQPTRSAIHLTTCEPESDRASVVLWWDGMLWPRKLPRQCPAEWLRNYCILGTVGLIPPPVGVQAQPTVPFRDGDCVPFWVCPQAQLEDIEISLAGCPRSLRLSWVLQLLLACPRGYLCALFILAVGLPGPAGAMMTSQNLAPEHVPHMSCWRHGNTRDLDKARGGFPNHRALSMEILRTQAPSAATHLVWRRNSLAMCLRMCSCTPPAVAEMALLAGLPSSCHSSVVLDGAPPDIEAVHWKLVPETDASPSRHLSRWLFSIALGVSSGWRVSLLSSVIVMHLTPTLVRPMTLRQAAEPVRVGAFPWHVAIPARTVSSLSETGPILVHLLSPFRGMGDTHEISRSCDWSWLVRLLYAEEPRWGHQLVPVWPNTVANTLTLVPVPPDNSLVCVVVVASTWRLSLCIPQVARLEWVQEAISHRAPQAFGQLFPPPPLEALLEPMPSSELESEVQATLHMRSGDVFYASLLGQAGSARRGGEVTVESLASLRHDTLWQRFLVIPFTFECTIWQPGNSPSVIEVPAGSRWLPHSQTFDSFPELGARGQWVIAPWAWGQGIHLCLRCRDAFHAHILIHCASNNLCVRTPTCADRAYVQHIFTGAGGRGAWTEGGDIGQLGRARRSRSPSRSGAYKTLKPRVVEVGLVHHPTSPRWRPAEHTVNLGGFPWIQTLCPVMGAAAPLRPHPHMPQQDIYQLVRATMQDWPEPLVPVWPALSMGALHLVPCPPPPLLCVAVVKGGEVQARLLLRDMPCRLVPDALGIGTDYAGPLTAAPSFLSSSNTRLRHGDLICARPATTLSGSSHLSFRKLGESPCGAQDKGSNGHLCHGSPHLGFICVLRSPSHLYAHVIFWGASPICQRVSVRAMDTLDNSHLARGVAGLAPSEISLRDGDIIEPSVPYAGQSTTELQARPFWLTLLLGRWVLCRATGAPSGWIGIAAVLYVLTQCQAGDVPHGKLQITVPSEAQWRGQGYRANLSAAGLVGPLSRCQSSTPYAYWDARPIFTQCWSCYLCPRGAPELVWRQSEDRIWEADLTPVGQLQEFLYEYWMAEDLPLDLPSAVRPHLRAAWDAYPKWTHGVPDQLLLATDGSGAGSGAWAFTAWAAFRGVPSRVVAAVDNQAALMVAAGHATASSVWAKDARVAWQALQSRVSTDLVHVPGHAGYIVNELADSLAGLAAAGGPSGPDRGREPPQFSDHWVKHAQHLWLVPYGTLLTNTCLVLRVVVAPDPPPNSGIPDTPGEPDVSETGSPSPVTIFSRVIQANVQTLKDVVPHFFNKAGTGQRRAYLVKQEVDVRQLPIQSMRLPVPICILSAHAPHADRPRSEIVAFWGDLRTRLARLPPTAAIWLGLDANADFAVADTNGHNIGTLVSVHEPRVGDDKLAHICREACLVAVSTFSHIHQGHTWTWQHSSGLRKRLDHILISEEAWNISMTRPFPDFDVLLGPRDHMPLMAEGTLTLAAPTVERAPRLCTPTECARMAPALWGSVGSWTETLSLPPQVQVETFVARYQALCRQLPRRPRAHPKQPYLSEEAWRLLCSLKQLRQDKAQAKARARLAWLRQCWQAWKGRRRQLRRLETWRQVALLSRREAGMCRRLHRLGQRDKTVHLHSLLSGAISAWHVHGRVDHALMHLKWASRRAAERRKVHSAGGYNIQAELREQFREQEQGRVVTPQQLDDFHLAWQEKARMPLPWPDGIRNGVWSHQPALASRWLWQLHAKITLRGKEPSGFKHALACALYKKGPAAIPSNYRSIVLLNGVAKIWHGHIRNTIGRKVVNAYQPLQLGGRPGMHVGYALTAYRAAAGLTLAAQHSLIALFVDVQAAFYEVDRELLFGDSRQLQPRVDQILPWAQHLLDGGALGQLGLDAADRALLQDCVSGSSWLLRGDRLPVLASRGSRPGDGLADVLFGAIMTCIIACLSNELGKHGVAHHNLAVACADEVEEPCPIAWADDLVLLADVPEAGLLPSTLRCMGSITLEVFQQFRLRVNVSAGKTEFLIDPRGAGATAVRGELLQGDAIVQLDAKAIRIAPEYKYLGVPQLPRDNGRRDIEQAIGRGRGAEVAAGPLLTRSRLPWRIREGWIAGRILPATYACLATSLAPGRNSLKPMESFLHRIRRKVWQTWQEGHHACQKALEVLVPVTSPTEALLVARCRLVVQLCVSAPERVWDMFEAALMRDVPWARDLLYATRQVWRSTYIPGELITGGFRQAVRTHSRALLKACKRVSQHGTLLRALKAHWATNKESLAHSQPLVEARARPPPAWKCHVCPETRPTKHALSVHLHRTHGVVSESMSFIVDTVCRWCLRDCHSTARLRYHIEHTPRCRCGLRHVVGPIYVAGTATKRVGAAGHLRVPPLQTVGPLLPTPLHRQAADEDRYATEAELQAELQRWVELEAAAGDTVPQVPAPAVAEHFSQSAPCPAVARAPVEATAAGWKEWRSITDDMAAPSPLWSGLQGHRLWRLSFSLASFLPLWAMCAHMEWWSRPFVEAARTLRMEAQGTPPTSSEGHIRQGASRDSCTEFRQRLLRATNTIFLLVASLRDTGALWWCGHLSQAIRTVFAAVDKRVVLHDVRWEGRSFVLASLRLDAVAAFHSELRRGLLASHAKTVQMAALHQSLPSP